MPETRRGERAYRAVSFAIAAVLAKGCVTVPGRPQESSNIFFGRHRETASYAQIGRDLLEITDRLFVVSTDSSVHSVC
jgi:hypothetical protein